MVVSEIVWLARLLIELTVSLTLPIPIFYDSQAALHIAKNLVFHECTKHIEVDCRFVRDQLQEGLIFLHHVPTNDQLANIFTKFLIGIKHSTLLGKLAVSSAPPT